MISFLWTLGSFIVALGILVAVHEWGHFWVARRCGVKVERFSIGFGKALWRRTDKLGTEYVIAAIPLGGYVKMLDERVDQVSEADLPYAFNRQHVLKRIAIIFAGPGVNFLFAIFALWVMYLIGKDTVRPVIGELVPDSVAAQSQLKPGLRIDRIGPHNTADWQAVNLELVSHIGEDSMQMLLSENGINQRTVTVDIRNWQVDPDKESPLRSLGIQPFRPMIYPEIATIGENSAASQANLRVGDKILTIDGTPVANWEQIVEYVAARPGQGIVLQLERAAETFSRPVLLGSTQRSGQTVGLLGITPKVDPWPDAYVFRNQFGLWGAIGQASSETWRLMTLSVEMLGKLITGDVSVKNLSGPISIAQGAGISAGYGLVYFLSFLALISVNLGIINLLPLPVLDGGHLLYYFIELLTGKPVSESVQEVGYRIGGVLLLMLMAVAIFNDIARL